MECGEDDKTTNGRMGEWKNDDRIQVQFGEARGKRQEARRKTQDARRTMSSRWRDRGMTALWSCGDRGVRVGPRKSSGMLLNYYYESTGSHSIINWIECWINYYIRYVKSSRTQLKPSLNMTVIGGGDEIITKNDKWSVCWELGLGKEGVWVKVEMNWSNTHKVSTCWFRHGAKGVQLVPLGRV